MSLFNRATLPFQSSPFVELEGAQSERFQRNQHKECQQYYLVSTECLSHVGLNSGTSLGSISNSSCRCRIAPLGIFLTFFGPERVQSMAAVIAKTAFRKATSSQLMPNISSRDPRNR